MVRATKEDKQRFQRLVELGCIVCFKCGYGYSQPEVHHVRFNASAGKKSKDTIPLCPQHHRIGGYAVAYHAGKLAFEANYGTEQSLLEFTNKLLGCKLRSRLD
jgi:predicted class III extradiol MEMO1 family dioxygenase